MLINTLHYVCIIFSYTFAYKCAEPLNKKNYDV